jgi:heat-inducible transcriptional repressor
LEPDDRELDERKKVILKAIIQTYLDTGEPVGSRTISKYTDLNLSSATIRNEMSDLEEMGYILQPHTSAGRIPSDKGYRYYVNELIAQKDQEITEVKDLMIQKTDRLESILKQVVKVLANDTNYATMIMPSVHSTRLKFIQLSKVHEDQLLAVIVAQGNMVKNRLIDLDDVITDEQLLKLNLLLNTELCGLSIGEINLEMIQKMKEEAGIHSAVISKVVDMVAEAIKPDRADQTVYTSGAKNIFRYPELANSESASELISAFEDKEELADILRDTAEDETQTGDIQVYIGQESPLQGSGEVSIVTANYDLGDGMTGRIGIVGPRRMDYKNVVESLKIMKVQLDSIFNNKSSSGDESSGKEAEASPSGTDSAGKEPFSGQKTAGGSGPGEGAPGDSR